MYFLYSLALSTAFLILLPYFIYQALRHGKYSSNFKERLGLLPESTGGQDSSIIWVHAVSVGEFLAALPLIEAIRKDLPAYRIVVSTTTITGQALARARLKALNPLSETGPQSRSNDGVFYFPFDWTFSVRRALGRVRPTAVIILETELWPNFLRECRRRGIVTVIANGRISRGSHKGYLSVRPFIARVMSDISLLIMQSGDDAERAISLGAKPERVRVCGNLKYDVVKAGIEEQTAETGSSQLQPGDQYRQLADDLDRRLALSASSHLIVAGSTAPGEEEMMIRALSEVRKDPALADTRLVVAPRHPERFEEVARLLAGSDFSFLRRSQVAAAAAINSTGGSAQRYADPACAAEVILLDTIGELAAIYRFAAAVFVGGSLVPRGGHNIIEPAAYGKPIIVGPYTENFRQIVADFLKARALVQIKLADRPAMLHDLSQSLVRLLSDGDYGREIGARARDILIENRGATACAISAIRSAISRQTVGQ